MSSCRECGHTCHGSNPCPVCRLKICLWCSCSVCLDDIGAVRDPLGTSPDKPYKLAPWYWGQEPLRSGLWCECATCGRVLSTTAYHFFASGAGLPLACEECEAKAETDRSIYGEVDL